MKRIKLKMYRLEGDKLVELKNFSEWKKYISTHDLTVKRDIVETPREKIEIHTFFLGMDMRFFRPGDDPVLFQTVVSGGLHHNHTDYYPTPEDARKGHDVILKMVRHHEL